MEDLTLIRGRGDYSLEGEIWRGAAVTKQAVLYLSATSPFLSLYPQHTFALFFFFFWAFSGKKSLIYSRNVWVGNIPFIWCAFVVWQRARGEKQRNRASRTFSRRRLRVTAFYMFVYTSSHHRQTWTNNGDRPDTHQVRLCVNLIGSGTNDVRPQISSVPSK